jgi:peptidoglycan L-alanyl-D-glutamate endopeptidase CwlK
MNTLREGSQGDDVSKLQERLKQLGFPPGVADGVFGAGTEAAVLAFQKNKGLVADGVVGPTTAAALGFAETELPPPPQMPNVTVQIVSKMFPATPLDHINRNLPFVLRALEDAELTYPEIVLVALATIRAETEGFLPISEGISRFNTSPGGHPFDLYDNRLDIGNHGPPDGASFKGRGFVQLTWRTNYERYGRQIGVDLIQNPEQANDPGIAARLLAAFIGSKETVIMDAVLQDDLRTARRLVNGGSNGLDRFMDAYRIGQRLLT